MEPSCWIFRFLYNYSPIDWDVAKVFTDRESFELYWREQHAGSPDEPVPAPPPVDFTTQRLIWHTFDPYSDVSKLYPAVLRCGDKIVYQPRLQVNHIEIFPLFFELVTIPQGDLPVVFLEPEIL